MRNNSVALKLAAALVMLGLLFFGAQKADFFDSTPSQQTNVSRGPDTDFANPAAGQQLSDLDGIARSELPSEALLTLQRIDDDISHPYRQDGSVFQNREGLLPEREAKHYREYTVKTPGERTRGARRIVAGSEGERYYTADHYLSFSEIVP